MKPYVPSNLTSLRPGCGCCIPYKSGHGHDSRRHNDGVERVKRNAKKAMRREGKKTCVVEK